MSTKYKKTMLVKKGSAWTSVKINGLYNNNFVELCIIIMILIMYPIVSTHVQASSHFKLEIGELYTLLGRQQIDLCLSLFTLKARGLCILSGWLVLKLMFTSANLLCIDPP